MGVDDIEGVVGKIEVVHVGGRERDVGQIASLDFAAGNIEHVGDLVDGRDGSGRDPGGQVGGDGAGSAADVEHGQPRFQVWQQVSRGVLGGASLVRAQHRLVMPVRVSRSMFVVHCGPLPAALYGSYAPAIL